MSPEFHTTPAKLYRNRQDTGGQCRPVRILSKPTCQGWKILTPVERAIDQMFVPFFWSTGDLVKIGEVIRAHER